MITTQQIIDTPLGWMVLQGDKDHIFRSTWVHENDLSVGQGTHPAPWKKESTRQIKDYFEGKRQTFNLPLKTEGSVFQELVWEKLKFLPYGSTTKDFELITPEQVQAVVASILANPLHLLIPCHRIEFSEGLVTQIESERSRIDKLLTHEGANQPRQLRLF